MAKTGSLILSLPTLYPIPAQLPVSPTLANGTDIYIFCSDKNPAISLDSFGSLLSHILYLMQRR